jgi:hypothetical protein
MTDLVLMSSLQITSTSSGPKSPPRNGGSPPHKKNITEVILQRWHMYMFMLVERLFFSIHWETWEAKLSGGATCHLIS